MARLALSTAALAFTCLTGLSLLAPAGLAQQQHQQVRPVYQRISSGTGFFINNSGYVITNEHVVRGCADASVRNTRLQPEKAKIVAVDADNDLALLRIRANSPGSAPIRANVKRLKPGDNVMVMGYPGELGVHGQYQIANATVIATDGPAGEPKWIRFSDAAQQGNSGGPLLDASGNVIGVVTAKTETFAIDQKTGVQTVIERSDVAVSLPYLWKFLRRNNVYPRTLASGIKLSPAYLERESSRFIVQVTCVVATSDKPFMDSAARR